MSNRLVSFHQSSKIVSSYILHFGNICKSSFAITSEFPISLRKLTKVHVQPIIDCVGLCTLIFNLIKFYSGPPQLYLMLKKKLSSLWSSWRIYQQFAPVLCFCKKVLVQTSTKSRTAVPCPADRGGVLWWLVGIGKESIWRLGIITERPQFLCHSWHVDLWIHRNKCVWWCFPKPYCLLVRRRVDIWGNFWNSLVFA